LPQLKPNVSIRLAPFAKDDLNALVSAVADEGQGCKQPDIVGALIGRAREALNDPNELERLAADVRAYRKRAKPLGF
jgi:hypothetical protein